MHQKKQKYGGELQRLSKWAALSGAKNLKYILRQEKYVGVKVKNNPECPDESFKRTNYLLYTK